MSINESDQIILNQSLINSKRSSQLSSTPLSDCDQGSKQIKYTVKRQIQGIKEHVSKSSKVNRNAEIQAAEKSVQTESQ